MYRPLKTPTNRTRFISLHPGTFNDEINCSFFHATITTPVSYEALSYVWSRQEDQARISVDRNLLKISKRLDNILRHLRRDDRNRMLWIDAICVNQSDKEERAAQVDLMSRIYGNAWRVLAWLGKGDAVSNMAVDFVERYGKIIDKYWAERREHELELVLLDPSNSTQVDALVKAFARNRYFGRAWIVQEIVMARDILVHFGARTAPWDWVVRILTVIKNVDPVHFNATGKSQKSGVDGYTWKRLDDYRKHRRKGLAAYFQPYNIISQFRWHQCAKRSDRIYSLLGLCDQWRDSFTRAMIQYFQSLNWLALAGTPRTFKTLPSWVPDFDLPLANAAEPLLSRNDLFSADKGSTFSATFTESNSLICNGVQLGRIPWIEKDFERVREMCLNGDEDSFRISTQLRNKVTENYSSYPKPWRTEMLKRDLQTVLTADRVFVDGREGIDRAGIFDGIEEVKREVENTSKSVAQYNDIMALAVTTLMSRGFFVSETGHLGLVPKWAEVGDCVCVIFGCQIPVLLRQDENHYRFVGECYIPRMMDRKYADLLKKGKISVKSFELR